MTTHGILSFMLSLLCTLLMTTSGCAAGLKGQKNDTIAFYGLAVDERGQPLEGAEFTIEVEAIPSGWTFEKRGESHVFSAVTAKSGRDGRVEIELTGHILRFKRVERAGYRHLFDLDAHELESRSNMSYAVNSWGDLCYKTDPAHPAVYVFVKDGSHEVSALPCAGGYASGITTQWMLSNPGWPRKPSLKDVVYVGPKPDFQRVVVPNLAADDPKAADIVFHGLVVDQTGQPLKGAQLFVQVELTPPPSWKVRPGDKLTVAAQTHVESGPDGRFEVTATGRNIRIQQWAGYRLAGYSELYDQDGSSPGQNISYSLDPTSLPRYRSDPDHPAVFVLVKLGVNEVSVLPSRGGYDSADGKTWVPNQPTRPRVPSLRWVQKYPTTAPK